MLVTHHSAIPNIKEDMDDKNFDFECNITKQCDQSRNMKIYKKNVQELWRLTFKNERLLPF
jgi:hypothetical protein